MTERNDEPLLRFPCSFPIKVVGRGGEDFELLVVELVRRHVPDLGEGAVSSRASRRGNYISVTVTVRARSREQLDAIYRELTACDRVIMAL